MTEQQNKAATPPPAVPSPPPAPPEPVVLACKPFHVFRFRDYVITPQGTKVAGEDVEAARVAALQCGLSLRAVKPKDA